jgi:hypothetical protein
MKQFKFRIEWPLIDIEALYTVRAINRAQAIALIYELLPEAADYILNEIV